MHKPQYIYHSIEIDAAGHIFYVFQTAHNLAKWLVNNQVQKKKQQHFENMGFNWILLNPSRAPEDRALAS